MLGSILAFVAAATALIMMPGPDSTLVLRNAIRDGRRFAAATALGTLTGLSLWVLAAAVGLAALIRTSPVAYSALRYAGAAYLVWLGIRSLLTRRAANHPADGPAPAVRSVRRSYLTGVATNVFNPKIGVFFIAFLPAFVPAHEPVGVMSLLLGAVFITETAAWLFLVIFAAAKLLGWLRRPRVRQRFEQVTGVILIGFAARLVLSQ